MENKTIDRDKGDFKIDVEIKILPISNLKC